MGIVQNMDWTGLDNWTGQLDWTVGLDYWIGFRMGFFLLNRRNLTDSKGHSTKHGLDWTGQLDWTIGLAS